MPLGAPLFEPSPPHLEFSTSAATATPQTRHLSFRNADRVPRRLRVEPLAHPCFAVAGPLGTAGGGSRVAPGESVVYAITYTPGAGGGGQCAVGELEVVTERERFAVPLTAVGPRPAVVVVAPPDEGEGTATGGAGDGARGGPRWHGEPPPPVVLTLPPAPVGGTSTLLLTLRNDGDAAAEVALSVEGAAGADDAAGTDAGLAASPAAFTADPQLLTIPPGGVAGVGVTLRPSATGQHRGQLVVRELTTSALAGGQSAAAPPPAVAVVRLAGAGVELPGVGLSTAALALPPAYVGRASAGAVTLTNPTAARLTFGWHAAPEGPAGFTHPAFSLDPPAGAVWPGADVSFTVGFTPGADAPAEATAWLSVTGRAGRLPLVLSGVGVGPLLALAYDAVDVGVVGATEVHRYALRLVNKGEIPGAWAIGQGAGVVGTGGGGGGSLAGCFAFDPPSGVLPPGQATSITATFTAPRAPGPLHEVFSIAVAGAAQQACPRVAFAGTITQPTLALEPAGAVECGTLPVGLPHAATVTLRNTSRVPLAFAARLRPRPGNWARGSGSEAVAGDGGGRQPTPSALPLPLPASAARDADDAVALQSHHCAADAGGDVPAVVSPAAGRLRPGEAVVLTVRFTPRRPASHAAGASAAPLPPSSWALEAGELVVDLPGLARRVASASIQGCVLAPDVTLVHPVVSVGALVLGHPTPGGTVMLANPSPVPAAFVLLPQDLRTARAATVAWGRPLCGGDGDVGGVDSVDGSHPPACGVIPPHGTVAVPITVTPHALGGLSIPIAVHIAGRLGGPLVAEVAGLVSGPTVTVGAPPEGVLWGALPVLAPAGRRVTVTNASPVAAAVSLSLRRGRDSRFAVHPRALTLPPGASREVALLASLDDCTPFADTLVVAPQDGVPVEVPLSAVGVGATLTCAEGRLSGPLEFGPLLCAGDGGKVRSGAAPPTAPPEAAVRTLTLSNRGRRALTLEWGVRPAAPAGDAAAGASVGDGAGGAGAASSPHARRGGGTRAPVAEPAFRVEPRHALLQPGARAAFRVVCDTRRPPGDVREALLLSAKPSGETRPLVGGQLTARATLALPRVTFDPPALSILYEHPSGGEGAGGSGTGSRAGASLLTRVVTVTNASPLHLDFTACASTTALALGGFEFSLPPGASAPLEVALDPLYRDDSQGHALAARVTLAHAGHPRVDVLPVTAELRFPNVRLGEGRVDFGCLHADTTARRLVRLENVSALPVSLAWALEEDEGDREGEGGAASGGGEGPSGESLPRIPANHAFDIIPPAASLAPGEVTTVAVAFRAHPGRAFAATALCVVAGGPTYSLPLAGSAGVADASVGSDAMDFGALPFDGAVTRGLPLLNPSPVPLPFTAVVFGADGGGAGGSAFSVQPAEGVLPPGGRTSLCVSVTPGAPGAVCATLRVTLAHLPAHDVALTAVGTFSCVAVELPTEAEAEAAASVRAAAPQRRGSAARVAAPDRQRRGSLSEPEQHSPAAIARQRDAATAALAAYLAAHLVSPAPQYGGAAGEAQGGGHAPHSTAPAAADLPLRPTQPVSPDQRRLSLAAHRALVTTELPHLGTFVLDFGAVSAGCRRTRTFGLVNAGQAPIPALSLGTRAAAAGGFSFSPNQIKALAPGQRAVVVVTFDAGAAAASGPVAVSAPLRVRGGPHGTLALRALVAVPMVAFTPPAGLDFGAVPVGQQAVVSAQLHNTSPVPAVWALLPPSSGLGAGGGRARGVFTAEPRSGTLRPGERVAVTVSFTPAAAGATSVALPLRVEHGPPDGELQLRGQGADPPLLVCVEAPPPGGAADSTAASSSADSCARGPRGASPSRITLGPQLPSAAPSRRVVALTNTGAAPIEVVCLELDTRAQEERAALLGPGGMGDDGVLRLPARAPGDALPHGKPPLAPASPPPGAAPLAAPGLHPGVPPCAPRPGGRALDVVVVGPPGAGCSSVAASIAQACGGCAVVTLDGAVWWARSGGGGEELAAALAAAGVPLSPPPAAPLVGDDAAALAAEAARLLAMPPPGSAAAPSTAAPAAPVKGSKPAAAAAGTARPTTPAAARSAAAQPLPKLPTALLAASMAARLGAPDCAYAAVVDGVCCGFAASPVEAVRALLDARGAHARAPLPSSTGCPLSGHEGGTMRVVPVALAEPSVAFSRLSGALAQACAALREAVAGSADAEGASDSAARTLRQQQLAAALARATTLRARLDTWAVGEYHAAAERAQQAAWCLSGLLPLPPAPPLPSVETPAAPSSSKPLGAAQGKSAGAPRPSPLSGRRGAADTHGGPDCSSHAPAFPTALPADLTEEARRAADGILIPVDGDAPPAEVMGPLRARLPSLPPDATPFTMDLALPPLAAYELLRRADVVGSGAGLGDAALAHFRLLPVVDGAADPSGAAPAASPPAPPTLSAAPPPGAGKAVGAGGGRTRGGGAGEGAPPRPGTAPLPPVAGDAHHLTPTASPEFPPQLGLSEAARWVIPPGGTVRAAAAFASAAPGAARACLTLAVTGYRRTHRLVLEGECAVPAVALELVREAGVGHKLPRGTAAVSSRLLRAGADSPRSSHGGSAGRLTPAPTPAAAPAMAADPAGSRPAAAACAVAGAGDQLPMPSSASVTCDFGPLPCGVSRASAATAAAASAAGGPRHAATLRLTNTGVLPATVDLSTLLELDHAQAWACGGGAPLPPTLVELIALAPTDGCGARPGSAGSIATAVGASAAANTTTAKGVGKARTAAAPTPPPAAPASPPPRCLGTAFAVDPPRIDALAPGASALVTVWALPAGVPPLGTAAEPTGALLANALVARVRDAPDPLRVRLTCAATAPALALDLPPGTAAVCPTESAGATAPSPPAAAGRAGSKPKGASSGGPTPPPNAAVVAAAVGGATAPAPAPTVTFPRQREGTSAQQTVMLRNTCLLPLTWRFGGAQLAVPPPDGGCSPPSPAVLCSPPAGTLLAGACTEVTVSLVCPHGADGNVSRALCVEYVLASEGFRGAVGAGVAPGEGAKPTPAERAPTTTAVALRGRGKAPPDGGVQAAPAVELASSGPSTAVRTLQLLVRGEAYAVRPSVRLEERAAASPSADAPRPQPDPTGPAPPQRSGTTARAKPGAATSSTPSAPPDPGVPSAGADAVALAPLPTAAELEFGPLRVHGHSERAVLVGNSGRYPLRFRVAPAATAPDAVASLTALPAEGVVQPGASVRVALTLTPSRAGTVVGATLGALQLFDAEQAGQDINACVDGPAARPLTELPLRAAWEAAFSAFTLAPARSLHFGPVLAGAPGGRTRTVELRNTGRFAFEWALAAVGSAEDAAGLVVTSGRDPGGSVLAAVGGGSAATGTAAPGPLTGAVASPPSAPGGRPAPPAKPGAAAKGSAQKSGAPGLPVPPASSPPAQAPPSSASFGAFTVEPRCGSLSPGEACTVFVAMRADGSSCAPGLQRASLRLLVGGFDHVGRSATDDAVFELVGELVAPGIDTADLAAVFEEHTQVTALSALVPAPHPSCVTPAGGADSTSSEAPLLLTRTRCAFATAERAFSFGHVLLGAHPDGVVERVRLTNPRMVPVALRVSVMGDDNGGGTAFSATAQTLTIPPYARAALGLCFRPTAVGEYRGSVTVSVADAASEAPPAEQLTFALHGVGALPGVSVEVPGSSGAAPAATHALPAHADGTAQLAPARGILFGRAFVGASLGAALILRAEGGVFPAVARLALPPRAPFAFGAAVRHLVRAASSGSGGSVLELTVPAGGGHAEVPLVFAPAQADHLAARAGAAVAPHAAVVEVSAVGNPFTSERVTLAGESLLSDVLFRLPPPTPGGAGAAEDAQLAIGETLDLGAVVSALGGPPATGGAATFQLLNTCGRPVRFEWPPLAREAAGRPQVTFTPRVGHLPAGAATAIRAALVLPEGQPPAEPWAGLFDAVVALRTWRITYHSDAAAPAAAARAALPPPPVAGGGESAPPVAPAPTSHIAGKPAAGGKGKPAAITGTGSLGGAPPTPAGTPAGAALPARALQRRVAPPADEPPVHWDDTAVAALLVPLTDSAGEAALAAGEGVLADDGSGVLLQAPAPEPPYAVVDDALPLTPDGAGVTSSSGPAVLPDGGVVVPAAAEAAAADVLPLRVRAAVDGVRFVYRRGEGGDAADAAPGDTTAAAPADTAATSVGDPTRFAFRPTFMHQPRGAPFTVRNSSLLPLAFRWEVSPDADMVGEGAGGSTGATGDGAVAVCAGSCDLSVDPQSGKIPPGGCQPFSAVFAPTRAGPAGASARMVVLSAPGGPPLSPAQGGFVPLELQLAGRGMRPVCHLDLPPCDYLARRPPLQAAGEGAQVELPPGTRAVEVLAAGWGARGERYVHVLNTTATPVAFVWERVGAAYAGPGDGSGGTGALIRCLVPSGVIPPGRRVEVGFTFSLPPPPSSAAVLTATAPPPTEALFCFRVPANGLEAHVVVAGRVVEPAVELDRPHVAFAPALAGSSTPATIALTYAGGPGAAPVPFTAEVALDTPGAPGVGADRGDITLTPAAGTLPAGGGSAALTLRYAPRTDGPLGATLVVRVAGRAAPLTARITGECFQLREAVRLLPCGGEGVVTSGVHELGRGTGDAVGLPAGGPATSVLPLPAAGLLLEPTGGWAERARGGASAPPGSGASPNVLDFGRLAVHDCATRQVAVTNHGRFPLDVGWSAVVPLVEAPARRRGQLRRSGGDGGGMPASSDRRGTASDAVAPAFTISPACACVPPGGTAVFDVSFRPTAPSPAAGLAARATLSLAGGLRTYDVALRGAATRPALEFSAFALDFGECLTPPSGSAPLPTTRVLTLTNREADRSVAVRWVEPPAGRAASGGGSVASSGPSGPAPSPAFHVGLTSALIPPGGALSVPVTFAPLSRGPAAATAVFQVNELHAVCVGLTGTGTPLLLELQQPQPSGGGLGVLPLGAVPLGGGTARTVLVSNRSSRPALMQLLGAGSAEPPAPPPLGEAAHPPATEPPPRYHLPPGVSLPHSTLLLPSRGTAAVEVRYTPLARAPPFEAPLMYRMAQAGADGTPCSGWSGAVPLVTLAGACVGVAVALEAEELAFGPVVVGSSATQSVGLVNDGDVAVDFVVGGGGGDGGASAVAPLPAWLSAAPAAGRLAPHSCTPITVTLRPGPAQLPAAAGAEGAPLLSGALMVRCTPCAPAQAPGVRSAPQAPATVPLQLPLRVTGAAVSAPPPAGAAVAFSCRAREVDTQEVPTPVNPTSAPWTLTPRITSASPGGEWVGAPSVVVPPGAAASYAVTYRPTATTAQGAGVGDAGVASPPPPASHEGSVFFPLPGGGAATVALTGTAAPPALAGSLQLTLPARTRSDIVLRAVNWLQHARQTLVVRWDAGALPPSVTLTAPAAVELPPGGAREVRLGWFDQLPGARRVTVRLDNPGTGEGLSFDVGVVSTQPPPAGPVSVRAPLRGRGSSVLTLPNPLLAAARGGSIDPAALSAAGVGAGGVVGISPECAHPAVRVVPVEPPLASAPTWRFRVEYRPLAPPVERSGGDERGAAAAEPPPAPAAGGKKGAAAGAPPAVPGASAAGKSPAGGSGAAPATGAKAGAGVSVAPAAVPPPLDAGVCPTATVLLRCGPALGDYAFALALEATPPAPAPCVEVAAPLGRQGTARVPFAHFFTAPGTYAVAVSRPDVFSVPPTVTVPGAATPAGAWEGVPSFVPVTFDGEQPGTSVQAAVTITLLAADGGAASAAGCAPAVVPLLGVCAPPAAAGPFRATPARPAELPFRNPWAGERDFTLAVEPPGAFAVVGAPSPLRLPGRGTSTLRVQAIQQQGAGSAGEGTAVVGRLTVTCVGAPRGLPPWVFYLQGHPDRPGEEAAVAAPAAAALPAAAAGGGGKPHGKPAAGSGGGRQPGGK